MMQPWMQQQSKVPQWDAAGLSSVRVVTRYCRPLHFIGLPFTAQHTAYRPDSLSCTITAAALP